MSDKPSRPFDAWSGEDPCVRNCCLDDADICVGCGRRLEDIRQWSLMSPQTQADVMRQARARVEAFRDRWKR